METPPPSAINKKGRTVMDRLSLATAMLADVLGEVYPDLTAGFVRKVAREQIAKAYTTSRVTCDDYIDTGKEGDK